MTKPLVLNYEIDSPHDGVAIATSGIMIVNAGDGTESAQLRYRLDSRTDATAVLVWARGSLVFSGPVSSIPVPEGSRVIPDSTPAQVTAVPRAGEARGTDPSKDRPTEMRYALGHTYDNVGVPREGVVRFATATDKKAAELIIHEHRKEIERLRLQIKQAIVHLSKGVVRAV